MSTALDILTILEAAHLVTLGTDAFANVLPETPDSATACFDITGWPPVTAHGNVQVNQRRAVQIQCRAVDPSAAAALCQSLMDAAVGAGAAAGTINVAANGHTYEMIRALGSAALLQRDQNGRTVFYGELEAVIDLG